MSLWIFLVTELFQEDHVFMSSKYHNTQLMIDYLIFMRAYSFIAYYIVAISRCEDY